jgi:hypothetical protein
LLSWAIRAIRRPAGAGAWSGMLILSDAGYRYTVPVSLAKNHASND